MDDGMVGEVGGPAWQPSHNYESEIRFLKILRQLSRSDRQFLWGLISALMEEQKSS